MTGEWIVAQYLRHPRHARPVKAEAHADRLARQMNLHPRRDVDHVSAFNIITISAQRPLIGWSCRIATECHTEERSQ